MARTVLFSNPEIADYINEHFEPVWQSVREVPTVTIDFGGGRTVKRTLNGNIATYVCNNQMQVIDVLPGVYTADAYRDRLEQVYYLSEILSRKNEEDGKAFLSDYHRLQWHRLRDGKSPLRLARKNAGGNAVLARDTEAGRNWSKALDLKTAYTIKSVPKDELESWEHLLDDVRLNETEMRKKIHERLCAGNSRQLESVSSLTKWMYRDVLHADIDDPYLGLKAVLDNSYPFKDRKLN